MTFAEFIDTTNNSYLECDNDLNRFFTFAEASYNEYLTNIKEAELKVIKESGTDDDLVYLEKGATEGFIVRTKKTIEKIIDAVVKFIKDTCKKINDFFNDVKIKATISKAEKAAKNNPKIKSMKVKIPDVNKGHRFFNKTEDQLDRKIAMFGAKKFSPKDKKDIENIQNEFNKGKAAAIGSSILVTIGVAIGILYILKKDSDKQEARTAEYEKKKSLFDSFDFVDLDSTDIHSIKNSEDAIKTQANVEKEHCKYNIDAIKEITKSLKSVITGSGEVSVDFEESESVINDINETNVEVVEEKSMEELDNLLSEIMEEVENPPEFDDEVLTESYNDKELEALMILESIEAENFNELTESDEVTYEEYLESMEAELFGDEIENELDALESALLDSDISDDEVEATLESIEAEIMAKEELDMMEAELFNDTEEDDEVVEESEGVTVDEYLDALENDVLN